MPIRCRDCGYERVGLPRLMRCPECGGLDVYLQRPHDPRRYGRWPGVLAPIGLMLCLGLIGLAALRLLDLTLASALLVEAGALCALGFVNWE